MRLIRFIHEQMTKPNAGIESSNEQSAHELRVEQESAEEPDGSSTHPVAAANPI